MLNIYNSPMTKADLDPETAYERQLHRLDCFFYVKGKTNEPCVHYQMVEVNDEGQATVAFYVNDMLLKQIIPSGQTCDVFVIANHPGSPAFEANQQGTDIASLGQYVLDMTQNEYDGIDKPFVMTGSAIAVKGRNSTVTADVALKRVAAKVTMAVKIPKSIEVSQDVLMYPVLADDQGNVTLKSSFRHGISKSYLHGDYPEDNDIHIISEKITYTLVSETDKEYVFECGIPFYTYARAWEKGSDHAAYMTFEMPWGLDENEDGKADTGIATYYYQILINGGGRSFERNCWYDMSVRVGILGSSVEIEPKPIDDLTYYILDWTTEPESDHMGGGDRHEDVKIENYTYLVVHNTRLEIDNASTGVINFDASHKVDVALSKKAREVEGVPGLVTGSNVGAFYVNCGSDPKVESLNITVDNNFEIDNTAGKITFTHIIDKSSNIYSPVYVYATVWLETDGVDGMSEDEEEFSEELTIVQYPAMYIIPDESVVRSVYVNSYRATTASHDVISINGWDLGGAPGTDNGNKYMHIITVSSFAKDDKFPVSVPDVTGDIRYIIGDPRQRDCDLNLNTSGYDMTASTDRARGWAAGVQGGQQVSGTLDHYYPTSVDGDAYRIVSPKFRISSRLGGYSAGDATGAKMRCASYQEDGYPAGRWRLPTTAEILFVIDLASKGAILPLFNGSSYYFSATHRVRNYNNNPDVATQSGDNSVRCVYDEWYWGSNQDAEINPNSTGDADKYLFTWGDAEVWPCDTNH